MYDLCIKLIVLGITSSIFELLFEPIAVNIFVWLIKTAVIKSFNQSQLELSMILFVSVSITSLLHVGTFSKNSLNNKSIEVLFGLLVL